MSAQRIPEWHVAMLTFIFVYVLVNKEESQDDNLVCLLISCLYEYACSVLQNSSSVCLEIALFEYVLMKREVSPIFSNSLKSTLCSFNHDSLQPMIEKVCFKVALNCSSFTVTYQQCKSLGPINSQNNCLDCEHLYLKKNLGN